ncbi:MAG: proline dehydrogenase family protein [Bacteroidetes bacterium]|nr:proline dehydrogenase family protein [Bacteroidota bacterium]
MPSENGFDNTAIAFTNKSDKELRSAYQLFRLLNNSFLSSIGTSLAGFAIKAHLPINSIIKATVFNHFCGGTSIEDCADAIQKLDNLNIKANLDFAVEVKSTEEDFEKTKNEILNIIEHAKEKSNIPFFSLKITGLASMNLLEKLGAQIQLDSQEKQDYDKAKARLDVICREAEGSGISLFIDAEESWIQDPIDGFATYLMEKYNRNRVVVSNTVQLYRKGKLAYLKDSYKAALDKGYIYGVKIVRGAYMVKERARARSRGLESPIHETKSETDKDYNLALEFCLSNIDKIFLYTATHNEESCRIQIKLMNERGIDKAHPNVYFSQLYGMGDHLSNNLANKGYNVAKFIPYGPIREVIPYLIRRANENTAMKGQMSRELKMIGAELRRRKTAVR